MDIIRNVGVCNLVVEDEKTSKNRSKFYHRNSLPNIALKYGGSELKSLAGATTAPISTFSDPILRETQQQQQQNQPHIRLINSIDIPDEECAVSGRLQIRVVSSSTSQPQSTKVDPTTMEQSPQPEESVYFDAITNGTVKLNRSDSNRSTSNNYDIKVYEDTLKIQKYKIINNNTPTTTTTTTTTTTIVHHREPSAEPEEEVSKSDSGRNKENESSRGAISKTTASKNASSTAANEIAEAENLLREITRNRAEEGAIDANSSSQIDELNENMQNMDIRRSDLHGSKIPVLNSPNMRISKCASWAGNEALLLQKELGDLVPGKIL